MAKGDYKKYIESHRRYREQHRDERNAAAREWRKNHLNIKVRDREFNLHRYGLTELQFSRLVVKQNGCCAICRTGNPGARKNVSNWFVDHDHVSGKVRGLLCNRCNRAIGQFEDSPDLLLRAAAYLERAGAEQNSSAASLSQSEVTNG
jgi:hypothetical protein